MVWWVTFTDRAPGCVDHGTKDGAFLEVAPFGTVKEVRPLPYPAEPRLGVAMNACPSFCYTPAQCAGTTACRKSYACSE